MCRGCRIKLKSNSEIDSTTAYLEWLAEHDAVIRKLKCLNKVILLFENDIADQHQRIIVGKFRRRLIVLRKQMTQAETILNEI